jgi:branched-chain amino acid aminotransferase
MIQEEAMTAQPFHDRDGWIWFDGEFVPHRNAKVHLLTHAMHYASAVFEGERAYDGVVFKSREHSERLIGSARLLGFEIPYSAAEIDRIKHELIAKQDMPNCYIRAIAWRGSEQMGVSAKRDDVHVGIASWEWGDYFADKMKGVRLMIAPWRRPAPDTAPCNAKAAGLYMICTLSRHAATDAGFDDAMMFDWRGQIAEGTGANIFFVRDGVLHTPAADCFLNGITRQSVIALARQRGVDVVERAMWPNELPAFSECFLTGSAAEITPVREIAGLAFKPGAMTEQLMHDFSALARRKNS